MISLPHNTPTLTTLPNDWWQVSFTLSTPIALEIGARLHMGETILAPWRIDGNHIDCLALPSEVEPDLTQAMILHQQGKPLPHIEADQFLLITGEDMAIADALLAASHLKHHAAHTLIVLAADNFPCVIKPARFMVASLPNLIAACPLLEDWGFANRLASNAALPGCFEGALSDLIATLAVKSLQVSHKILAF